MSTIISFPKKPENNKPQQPSKRSTSIHKWLRTVGYIAMLPVRFCLQLVLVVVLFVAFSVVSLAQLAMPYVCLGSFIATMAMWFNEHNTSWHDPWLLWIPASVFVLSVPAWFMLERLCIRLREINLTRKASYLKNPPEKVYVNL